MALGNKMLKTQESLGLVPIRGGFTMKLKSPGAPPLPGSGPSSCLHGRYGFVRYFNCSGLGLLSLHYAFPSLFSLAWVALGRPLFHARWSWMVEHVLYAVWSCFFSQRGILSCISFRPCKSDLPLLPSPYWFCDSGSSF